MLQGFRAFVRSLGPILALAACSTLPQAPPPTHSLEARAAAIAAEVSRVRGLELKSAVPVGKKDKPSLRAAYQELIQEEWSDHDDGTERAYKLFGLLPEEMHLKSYLLDLYSAQVAGYYDPRKSEFFVVETAEPGLGEEQPEVLMNFVIAHELVHALQDQHFDLKAIQNRFKQQNDRGLASVAVMEGDATLAAFDHLLWQRVGWPLTLAAPAGRRVVAVVSTLGERFGVVGDTPEAQQLRDAPAVIRAELFFAYLRGMAFVSAVRAEFGWEGVDAVFRDLPDSTEQILHPERYIDRRDRPATVHLAEPPAGWEPVFEESLGMLTTQVLLREHLGRRAARAAEGWDGDRYVVWESPTGAMLGWLTVWDRPHQARRFMRTYRRLLRRKLRDAQPFAIRQRGYVVAAVEGGAPGEAEAAASRLLASRIEHPADDWPPESGLERWLRWPLSVRQLDQVFEVACLGGHLFRLRNHDRGHQLSLLDGWLGRSERNPDRHGLSTAGGLIWASADRNQAYRAGGLTPLFDFQTRAVGPEQHAEFGLVRLPFLGPVLSLRREAGVTRLSLLRGLALRIQWGPGQRPGSRVRVLLIPIPGL